MNKQQRVDNDKHFEFYAFFKWKSFHMHACFKKLVTCVKLKHNFMMTQVDSAQQSFFLRKASFSLSFSHIWVHGKRLWSFLKQAST